MKKSSVVAILIMMSILLGLKLDMSLTQSVVEAKEGSVIMSPRQVYFSGCEEGDEKKVSAILDPTDALRITICGKHEFMLSTSFAPSGSSMVVKSSDPYEIPGMKVERVEHPLYKTISFQLKVPAKGSPKIFEIEPSKNRQYFQIELESD